MCWRSLGLSLLAVGAVALVGWLILRQPAWRAVLTGAVTHRTPTAFAAQRQILAPRSLALAGTFFIVLGGVLAFFKRRSQESVKLNWRTRLTQLFISFQALIALAVVINLFAFFLRTFGRPPCALNVDTILRYWVPQAYPHSRELFEKLGEKPQGIALRVEGGTFNRYLFSALIYPHRVYAADDVVPEFLPTAPSFRELRAKRDVSLFLHYDPFSTTQPLMLYRLEGQ